LCKVSPIYDEAHYAKYEDKCHFRHTMHRWPAVIESKGTLISDSLCKWVKDLNYLDVQSLPGLKLQTAMKHIESGFIRILDYEFVFLHVGTNNVESMPIDELKYNLHTLIKMIKSKSPFTTVAVSSILHRPKAPICETYRMTVNNSWEDLCIKEGHYFLESWKKFESKSGEVNMGLYAKDKLHFNEKGIEVLRNYFDGAIGMIADKEHKRV
jgi:hypothetical protein